MAPKDHPKAGQKFPTPTPGFGDRVFYVSCIQFVPVVSVALVVFLTINNDSLIFVALVQETLLRQRPDSAMAQDW